MLKNITDKPITIMWGCSQRTIFPNEIIDIDKEFDCVIEQRFADKYAGKLIKYIPETIVTFSNEVTTTNLPTEIKIVKVIKKQGRPKKRKI